MKYTLFLIVFVLFTFSARAQQRIGLVLSGGGAAGLAHVGLLIALEEEGIPIDYITGTSAGALVGAMYASGIPPTIIKEYVLQEEFLLMTTGELSKDQQFLLRKKEQDASMLSIPFSLNKEVFSLLPTNFITPAYFDYEMFRIFGLTSSAVGDDFDQLFVPFRCVAADVQKKQPVVFSNHPLNAAVRASMTFPFYVNPIRVDGQLLFDGGLYNNFPADVLFEDFGPDYIIGSNVSGNAKPPKEDDLISQLNSMMVTPTDFSLPCENGIIISPKMDVSTFDFEKAEDAIEAGYLAAKEAMDSIKLYVQRRIQPKELQEKRRAFTNQMKGLRVTEIISENTDGDPVPFVEKSIQKDSLSEPLNMESFTKRYFRVYASPQIKYLYPTIERKKDSTHRVKIEVTKQKPFVFKAGGHFSSRPVNTGYVGVSYLGMKDGAITLNASSYFGKFYGSTALGLDFDVPAIYPFRVSPYFRRNRWDYFRSFTTFFEESQPSFLVQNESYYGVNLQFPIGNQWKLSTDFRAANLRDEYYQIENFSSADTSDRTAFDGQTVIASLERNTLNRKQWANSGNFFKTQLRFVQGREQSLSGSTAPIPYDVRRTHQWLNLSVEAQSFVVSNATFHFGLHGKGVLNSQSLFANYTASILMMNEFSPLPDISTFFFEEFRAPQYIGAGMNFIFSLSSRIDIRFDPYFFQPFRQIEKRENGTFGYSDLFTRGSFMAAGSVIFHSPIGPLRFTTNYFPNQDQPFVAQLSFGYVLFNERAVR